MVRRELIATTFHVYPIKDYGAIQEGEHRFCELATGRCEGIAKFVIVWTKARDAWPITNMLSYGHRPATPTEQAATKPWPRDQLALTLVTPEHDDLEAATRRLFAAPQLRSFVHGSRAS